MATTKTYLTTVFHPNKMSVCASIRMPWTENRECTCNFAQTHKADKERILNPYQLILLGLLNMKDLPLHALEVCAKHDAITRSSCQDITRMDSDSIPDRSP